MAQEIQDLNDLKRDFITDTIILLAKLDFRRKFLEWFMEKKGDELEKDYKQDISNAISESFIKYNGIIDFFMGKN